MSDRLKSLLLEIARVVLAFLAGFGGGTSA